jgi:hypothetical protein
MKIKLDIGKLRQIMKNCGIKNYSQLARDCGISYDSFISGKNRYEIVSLEILWCISDELGVSINDLVYPDWEDSA